MTVTSSSEQDGLNVCGWYQYLVLALMMTANLEWVSLIIYDPRSEQGFQCPLRSRQRICKNFLNLIELMRIMLCSFGKTESGNSGRTSFCDWPVTEVKVLFILYIVLCAVPGDRKCTILDSRQSVIILMYLMPKVHSFLIGWIYHSLIIRYLPVSGWIISTPKWTVKFSESVSVWYSNYQWIK